MAHHRSVVRYTTTGRFHPKYSDGYTSPHILSWILHSHYFVTFYSNTCLPVISAFRSLRSPMH
eukprot:750896-Hanusia_phi.AAC.4